MTASPSAAFPARDRSAPAPLSADHPVRLEAREVGRFSIYASAKIADQGFVAGVAVYRRNDTDELAQCVLLVGELADGFRFRDVNAALHYAADIGHRFVRQQHA